MSARPGWESKWRAVFFVPSCAAVRTGARAPSAGDLEFTVIEVYDDSIDLPAIPEKTSKAVTY